MRKLSSLGFVMVAIAIVASAVLLRADGGATPATAAGGATLSLGTVTFDGTHVRVPVLISGSGFAPYGGVTLVLLWDPAVFTFFQADTTGTVIPSPFCASGTASSSTGPHNGVTDGENVGCATLAGSTSVTGLAVTIVLAPISGCSPLHLLTLGPPDNDANGSGTQDALGANQVNLYGTIDATVNAAGAPCSLPTPTPTNTTAPTATHTPTITPTPTITNTPTVTNTPTPTNTPQPGATFTPTNTPVPIEPPYCVIRQADVNMDGTVNLTDFIIVAGSYGKIIPPAPARYDQNGDGKISLADLIIMSAVYGQNVSACPPPPTPTFTATPTNTPTPTNTATPTPPPYCVIRQADVDMDGKVTLTDLIIVAGWYGKTIPPAPARYDQNADGKIGLADLIIMSAVYMESVSLCP